MPYILTVDLLSIKTYHVSCNQSSGTVDKTWLICEVESRFCIDIFGFYSFDRTSESDRGFQEKTVEPEERYPTRRHLDSRRGRSYVLTERNQRERACKACSGKHPIWKCEIFGGWTAQRRWDFAKKCGLCFRCLREDHFGKTCSRDRGCTAEGCKKRHHSLLHYENATQQRGSDAMEGNLVTRTSTMETIEEHEQRNVAL